MKKTPFDLHLDNLAGRAPLEKRAMPAFLLPLLGWLTVAGGAWAGAKGLGAAHDGLVGLFSNMLQDSKGVNFGQGALSKYLNPKSGKSADSGFSTQLSDTWGGLTGKTTGEAKAGGNAEQNTSDMAGTSAKQTNGS